MSATFHSLAQNSVQHSLADTLWGAASLSGPSFHLAQTDRLLRNQLISLACLYSTAVILTSLQDHENPHQVQSRREDGSYGPQKS